jgi:amino acid transporter
VQTVVPAADQPPRAGLIEKILGPPLRTDQEHRERLGNPTALAVLSSDALSSVAYATEEMVKVLVPVAGVAAFTLLLPISAVVLAVLFALIFSYRQTIKAYPSAGGAYIVTKDNFGLLVAQVAGVSLLLDYTMTVAVSVSAGVAAIYSAAPSLYPYRVLIAVALIWTVAWANLRGVRASGQIFATPTYLFIASVLALVVVGLVRMAAGTLHPLPVPPNLAQRTAAGMSLFVLAHAYASGSTALTGVEAISNGVPVFREPAWRNARAVLTWMGAILAVLFAGITTLAWKVHPVPTATKTLVAELARAVFGNTGPGQVAFLFVQVMTTAILIMAANTSFADFPRLASFHAADGFMPEPFRRRGRRLVYSVGILTLALVATTVTVLMQADVHRLIPLYAVGVFTAFTLSQAGMTARHVRAKELGWRQGAVINGAGGLGSGLALVAILVTKFAHGAWMVTIIVPSAVALFYGIHRHYETVRMRLADLSRCRLCRAESLDVLVVAAREDAAVGVARWYAGQLAHASDVRSVRPSQVLATARRAAAEPGHVPVVVLPERRQAGGRLPAPNEAATIRLRKRLERTDGIVLVCLPVVAGRPMPIGDPPPRHTAVVTVDRVDVTTHEAVHIAQLLGPDELHVVHFDRDRDETDRLLRGWRGSGLPVGLEVVAAPYREPVGPLFWKVGELRRRGTQLVSVVIPTLVPRWWQRPLYARDDANMRAALLVEQGVAIVGVNHRL